MVHGHQRLGQGVSRVDLACYEVDFDVVQVDHFSESVDTNGEAPVLGYRALAYLDDLVQVVIVCCTLHREEAPSWMHPVKQLLKMVTSRQTVIC